VPRIIPNNQITLLQNGEEYFPAIEAALDRVVHEIYLERCIIVRDTLASFSKAKILRKLERKKTNVLLPM